MIGVLGGTFDPVHFGHLRPALEVRQALGLEELRLIPLRQAVHRSQPQASPEQRLAMLRLAVQGAEGLRVDDRELRRGGESYTHDTLVDLRGELGPAVGLGLLVGADAFRGFLSWHRPDDILALAHLIVMRRPGWTGEGGPAPGLAPMEGDKASDAGGQALAGDDQVSAAGNQAPVAGNQASAGGDPLFTAGDQAPLVASGLELSSHLQAWLQPRRCFQVGDLTASPAGRVWFQEVTQLAISATRIRGLVARGLSPRYLLPDTVLDFIQAEGLYRRADP
ncbi:MAG: nicotinate (nicotinamide) nucleotide adenylyltransferase [Gammaproteobacteria bacterium]|jgi:nicotinate (nicotinamide) nucleotide adenylyltransferase|nr:nicotinate (nicotinamide) nucleotide adenylyltransferase [Gammaproteobacteria bacterium]